MQSKLLHGNTYVLKRRNARGQVESLHILDPKSVKPLVSTEGGIYYQLRSSNLAVISEPVTVPAREIIHDRGMTPHHPLVGVSPLTAALLAATQGT